MAITHESVEYITNSRESVTLNYRGTLKKVKKKRKRYQIFFITDQNRSVEAHRFVTAEKRDSATNHWNFMSHKYFCKSPENKLMGIRNAILDCKIKQVDQYITLSEGRIGNINSFCSQNKGC